MQAPVYINEKIGTDCEAYRRDAFVPHALSDTLELLLADYAMGAWAEKRGHTADATHHFARAKRYAENYDAAFGFMCPRDENGKFLSPKDEYDELGCCESNIFQQGWFVPYDVVGLSRVFGEKRTVELLERLFEGADLTALWNKDYNHSNEPCHNITHYFALLGLPERTQYWTRRVQKESYRTGAYGFCGNEDVGQLSAWYVLSALGLAQVCIGNEAYVVNTPLFKRATLSLDKRYHSCSVADTFTVCCDRDPLRCPYIRSMTLNGQPIERPYLTYSEITAGGVLNVVLSESPCNAFETYAPSAFLS